MQPPPLGFSAPAALRPIHAHAIVKKKAPVCVLDERPAVKSGPGSPAAIPTKGKDVKSPFYTILPADLPKEKRPKPPTMHWSLPVFGFLVEHWLKLSSPAMRARKFGGIYKASFLLQPMVFVSDMPTIADMQKDPETFRSKGGFEVVEALFGSNTMTALDGIEHTAKTWAAVEKEVKSNGKTKLDPVFRKHYLSIIVEMTTGIDMDSEMAAYISSKFLTVTYAFFSPPFGPIWDKGMKARDDVVEVLEDVLRRNLSEKKDTIEKLRVYGDNLSYQGSKDIRKGDVNVLLIAIANSNLKTGDGEENDPEVVKNLVNLILLLWFAGYATSAATTSCAAFEMGMDSGIWDKLLEEQEQLVAAESDREVQYSQVTSKMPLLDSFITEMLRMHPAAGGVLRVATKDVDILGRYVEAGQKLFLDFMGSMRDPRMYPDPDTVVIDRFVRKEGKPTPPRVIAFGGPGSPHYCLGAALAKVLMKTTLSVLLREYSVEMDPNQSREYAVVPDETPVSKVVVQKFERRLQVQ